MFAIRSGSLALLWLFVTVQVVCSSSVGPAVLENTPTSLSNNERDVVMPGTPMSKQKMFGELIGYKRLAMPAYYARKLWPSAGSRQRNENMLHQAYALDALRGLRKPAIATSDAKDELADKLFRASVSGRNVLEYIPSEGEHRARTRQLISLIDAKELANRDYRAVYRIDGRGFARPRHCWQIVNRVRQMITPNARALPDC